MPTSGDATSPLSTRTWSRCTAAWCSIRGFEERVAALYRDGLVPGFVHLSIGQEATAVGACWPLRARRRHHLDPSRPRPLPRQGPRPRAHVRRADGHGRGTNRGRGGSMHIADPGVGRLRRQRHRGGRPAHRRGRGDRGAAARQRRRRRGVLRRRRRRRRARSTRRSTSPRCGGCRWSSSARTTATRSSRPPRPSTRRRLEQRAAGYGIPYLRRRRQRRGGHCGGDAATPWPAAGSGAGPTVVEAATYRWHGHYEGDPQRYRSPGRSARSGRRATRSSATASGSSVPASTRPTSTGSSLRWRPSSTVRSRAPALAAAVPGLTLRFRGTAAGSRARNAPAHRATAS